MLFDFDVLTATHDTVWLRPRWGRRRAVRVEHELLVDLADASLPVNRGCPEQAAIYARLLVEVRHLLGPTRAPEIDQRATGGAHAALGSE